MQLLPRAALAVAIFCVSGVQAQTGERESGSPAPADKPRLTVPPQVMVAPGQPFRVKVETNCTAVRWTCPGVVTVPREWCVDPDTCFVAVAPTSSGTYTLAVTGALGRQWADATCLIICGTAPAPPGPSPTPPGPGPAPPPGPPPSGPLADELRKLYAAEPPATRAQHVAILAAIYRTAEASSRNDASITTVAQLFGKVRGVGQNMLGPAAVLPLRNRIAAANTERFPTDAQPLDDPTRKAASEWFASVALILESLR